MLALVASFLPIGAGLLGMIMGRTQVERALNTPGSSGRRLAAA